MCSTTQIRPKKKKKKKTGAVGPTKAKKVELCREKERTIYEERDKGRFKPCLLEEDGISLGILSLLQALLLSLKATINRLLIAWVLHGN